MRYVLFALGCGLLCGAEPEYQLPEGLIRYARAEHTQSISVLNGRDDIRVVPRTNNEAKYQIPGGLVGISDWRSDLYQAPMKRQQWVGNIAVKNSFGYFQNNRGWLRQYPDGMMLVDVLTNTRSGKVFEVRVAEKNEGRWVRFVDFRNKAERPAGYVGLKRQQCRECHAEAGSGGYAQGLVAGGDSVISDPIRALDPTHFD